MKKLRFVGIMLLIIAASAAVFSLGMIFGYDKCDKDYQDYLPVVYGRGQQEVIEGITNMSKAYPDLFNGMGDVNSNYDHVVTYSMDYLDGNFFKILWVKQRNGKLIIGREPSWDDVPTK